MIRVASVQANVIYNDPSQNAANAIEALEDLASKKVDLAVFPEAFLTGYCVRDAAGAESIRIPRSHNALEELRDASNRLGILAVVGFAEEDGGLTYNSAALLEPNEAIRIYRKTHLPDLGLDKFATPGSDLTVFQTRIGKVGILVCFDMRYPEATRSLALQGADIVCLPTNWPEGAECSAQHICIARAAENRVFFVTCNRVGTENGFRFIGQSKIVSPAGEVLASAGTDPAVLIADLDFEEARTKRTITIPGLYETDVMGLRRTELYRLS